MLGIVLLNIFIVHISLKMIIITKTQELIDLSTLLNKKLYIDNLFLLGIDFSKIRCSDKVKEYYTGLEAGVAYGKTRIFAVEEEPELSACLL